MGMSRKQLLSLIGVGNIVEPTIKEAYEDKLRKEWEEGLGDDPHGYKWHTRLHASSAPGSDAICKRKLLYGLLDLPKSSPDDFGLIRYAEVGLDAEARLVDIWDRYGILLSAHTDDEHQTNLVEPDLWFSGNMDAAILRRDTKSPHIVEIKSRGVEKVKAMKNGTEDCDPKHEAQVRSYISMAHEQELFLDDERVENICDSGSVLYIARDNPNIIHEFTFEYSEKWWEETKARTKEVQEAFLAESIDIEIPTNEDGSKVGWSKGECQYCPLKKTICKPDYTEGITDLRDSHAITVATEINPNYSYEEAKERVLNEWS